jgi:hypothetical protein
MPREHTAAETDDYAMRMAWIALPDDAKDGFRGMAKFALVVHEELMERAKFEAIVNPAEGS